MGKREINCKEKECKYFRECYQVDRQDEDYYTPRFGQTTKHYTHPKVYTALGNIDDTGTLIHTLKECPNGNGENGIK